MYLDPRNVFESAQRQGANEIIAYAITYARQPEAVNNVKVIDLLTGQDVTSTHMPQGSPSVGGLRINLPPLTALTPNQQVRVVVNYLDDRNNTLESIFVVEGVA